MQKRENFEQVGQILGTNWRGDDPTPFSFRRRVCSFNSKNIRSKQVVYLPYKAIPEGDSLGRIGFRQEPF